MTRQHMNDRWCVRCNKCDPTPYLRRHWMKLLPDKTRPGFRAAILDIGCGNGRNLEFMRSQGFTNTLALDMKPDYGFKIKLGHEMFPVFDQTVNIVLANYVFMFLSRAERSQVLCEIKRAAAPGKCSIIVELYPAKDSHAKTHLDVAKLQIDLEKKLGWKVERTSKARFIATNTSNTWGRRQLKD